MELTLNRPVRGYDYFLERPPQGPSFENSGVMVEIHEIGARKHRHLKASDLRKARASAVQTFRSRNG
jgi:hypothetical protein